MASGAKLDMENKRVVFDLEDGKIGMICHMVLTGLNLRIFGHGEIFSDIWSPVMEKFMQALGMHSMRNLSLGGGGGDN